ncbi:MAG: methylated-DNA--[protein]-cysteine S-methyltransferase [Alphaproteobacteria bacterium]|nr:methylated-DNA--[protein]-cysteine S-methyltransferase [Alphaproteobacteria bacterium]
MNIIEFDKAQAKKKLTQGWYGIVDIGLQEKLLIAGDSKTLWGVFLAQEKSKSVPAKLRTWLPFIAWEKNQSWAEKQTPKIKAMWNGKGDMDMTLIGTPFQRSVWKQLLKIPRGKTKTYLDVAKAVKKPRATRAVGTAVGSNPITLLVPCHRVLASNGGLGGFAWGLPVKKRWLNAEGALKASA